MNLAILWRLLLVACGLCRGSLRLGACSFLLLIKIRGPNLAQPLLMILSSAAMVSSCGPDALLTSIVNFFIYPLLLLRGPWTIGEFVRSAGGLTGAK